MCRVNLSHTRRRRISMNTLLDEVGVRQIRWYYETRLLRWVGHVVRMPIDRLPRKMLTAWVPSKRVIGCPRMTYGRTVKKALMNCGIWPRYPKFTAPPGWDFMDAGTQSSLRREHIAAKNAHDKEHAWKWTEKAAEREEWRTLIRGPDPPKRAARPKSTRRPPQHTRSNAAPRQQQPAPQPAPPPPQPQNQPRRLTRNSARARADQDAQPPRHGGGYWGHDEAG